jgi:ribosomal protein S6
MAKTKEIVMAETEEARMTVYEVGYIMVPTIAEESLAVEVTTFKDSLAKEGATFIADEFPKMTELAYEMARSIANKKNKFSYGYFGWVKFEASTEHAKVIKSMLDKNETLVRYLMIKTVRESTLGSKRPYGKESSSKRRTHSKDEEVAVASTEEASAPEVMDKEIDALVV